MSLFEKIKSGPRLITALVILVVTWVNFNQVRWDRKDVIDHDVKHYYSYLPALFYEHDLTLSFMNDTVNSKQDYNYYITNHAPNGNKVIKMSMGMAVTYLPFFGLAHVYATLTDGEVSGFSEPYQFAVQFSSLFYFVIGLFYLSRILRSRFGEKIVSLTLFCICFGTNVFFYLTYAGGLSHTTSFAFIAAFVYYCLEWHREQTFQKAALLGILGGLAILIRPINILIFIFFIFYNVVSGKELVDKVKLLFSKKTQVFIIMLFSFLILLPQFLYWKYVTGNYLFNSYVGEHFYFSNPHILKALFGFRKGWLVYTPIMLFSLTGFYFLYKTSREFFLPVLILLLVYIYVAFSWWCWWYGGSFGQRVMIDIYPVLAIPFAATIQQVLSSTAKIKNTIYSILSIIILLNLFQTIQAKYNIIHYDSMTKESYFKYFFSISKSPDREKYLEHPDYENARQGQEEERR